MAHQSMSKDEIRAVFQERESILKEQFVKTMMMKLVKDELAKCQKHEGVNALQNCSWLARKYTGMLNSGEYRVKGWRKIERWNSPPE